MSTNSNDVGNQLKKDNAEKNNNSPFRFLQMNKQELLSNPYVEGVIRVFGTSVTVATVLHPMDVIMTNVRSNGFAPMMANHQLFSKLFTGFLATQKQAAIKNMVIANKDKVKEQVGGMMGENENVALKKYKEMLVTTVIVGGVDTILTQYYANKRILNALGDHIELTLGQKFKFAKEGMMTRGGRNVATTLACISATTTVSEFINPLIPKDNNVFAHTAATSVISGCLISPFVSALDNVYQEKIRRVNKSTLKTPPTTDIFMHLWQQGGMKRMIRGSGMGAVYNLIAFGVINGVAEAMNTYLFPRQSSSVSQQGTFFAQQPPKQLTEATPQSDKANDAPPSAPVTPK